MHAKGLKARGLDLGSVSGDINVSDVTCERLGVKTVSGSVEYSGGIAKDGRYEINAHSGNVRLMLANPAGFELNANSFSGSIRSELPLTIGGDAARRDDGSRGRRQSGRQPFDARDVRRRQRDAHDPHVQRGHRHRQAVGNQPSRDAWHLACSTSV